MVPSGPLLQELGSQPWTIWEVDGEDGGWARGREVGEGKHILLRT